MARLRGGNKGELLSIQPSSSTEMLIFLFIYLFNDIQGISTSRRRHYGREDYIPLEAI